MAVNLAISTEQLHEPEPDIELGLLGASSLNLIEEDPAAGPLVERGTSIPSVHSSVRTAGRKFLRGVRRSWTVIKDTLSDMKLFFVVMLYSVLGAGLFMWIEIPNNLSDKQVAHELYLVARDTLLFRLRIIHAHDGEDRENRWKEAILDFENSVGVSEPSLDTDWTFWMSFLYSGTVFTTIGYGNIACKTFTGQLVTMFYAMIGIPLTLVVLNDLGKKLLTFIKKLSDVIGDIILFLGLRLGLYKPIPGKAPRFHLSVVSRRAMTIGVFSAGMDSSEYSTADSVKNNEEDIVSNPPVVAAVIFTIAWLFLCAGIFCLWEDWTYWTSFYFFFISLSTIGFGDVSPAHPEYMFMTFGVVLVGLAMVSVCINVVQERLSQLYMAMLDKMLKDFQAAAERGDQGAAVSGMMASFQNQAKFLMPLMSKSQGAKVMTQFKDKAKAQGIELPPVLTNLDPETGMPAFAKAKAEDFEQYIEKANEQAKPPEVKMVEVQTDAFEPPPPPPVEKPKMTTSFTQYHLSTASVHSETTDLIRMVNAQAEAKIYADSAESSTQVELDHLEAGVQVFIDVRPQSIDAETETQISYSDIDCQTPSELVSPSKSVTTSEQACQSSVSGEDFSQQTSPDVQHNVAQTIATESRERQMQTVPEVEQVIPLQSAPPQCSEIETQTEAFARTEASHQTEWGSADFAVQASLGDEPKDTAEFGAQFEPPPLETLNFGVQASPDLSETQSQTSETPSNDSGIQTWVSMDDISTQAGAESEHCESQTAFSYFALQDNFSQHEEDMVSAEMQSDFSMFNCTSSDAQSDSLTFLMQDASTQQNIAVLKSAGSQSHIIVHSDNDAQTEAPPESIETGIQPDVSNTYVPKDRVEHPLETEEDRQEPLFRFFRQTSIQTEYGGKEVVTQTESSMVESAMQCAEVLTFDSESQTIIFEYEDSSAETAGVDVIASACQTESVEIDESSMQTAAVLKSDACQTDIKQFGDSWNQTESGMIDNISQTTFILLSDREVQAQATTLNKEMQTAPQQLSHSPPASPKEQPVFKVDVQSQETETDFNAQQDAMSQTDRRTAVDEETSTDGWLSYSRDDHSQTESSSFHVSEINKELMSTSTESVTFLQDTAIQTLVSGFYDTEETKTPTVGEEEQTFLHDSGVQTDHSSFFVEPDYRVILSDGFVQTDTCTLEDSVSQTEKPDVSEMGTMAIAVEETQEASVQVASFMAEAAVQPDSSFYESHLHSMITQTDTSMFPYSEQQGEDEDTAHVCFMQDASTSPEGLVESSDAQSQSEGHLFHVEAGTQVLVDVAHAISQHDPLIVVSTPSQSRIVKYASKNVQVSLIEYSQKDPVLVEDVQLQCSINLSQQLHRSTQIGQSWFDRADSQVQTAILSSDSVTQCSLLFDEEKAIQLSVSAQTDPSPVEETVDQVEFSCQTEVTPALDFFCQTEIVAESPRPEVKDDETQVDEDKVELADGECQADMKVLTEDHETQVDEHKVEQADGECQADVLTEDHEVQVEMELPALPEKEVREMQVQVDLEEQAPEQTHQDCQTDIEEPVEEGAETTDSAVQVERWDVYDCSAQTEAAENVSVDAQTESTEYVSVDAQTEDAELQEEEREEEKEDAPAPWADFETEDIIGLRMKLLDHTMAADTIENESQTETSLFAHDATQVELIMRDIETEMEVTEESQEIGVQSDLSSFDYRDSQTQSEEQEQEAGVDVSDATTQSEEIAFQFGQDEAVQPMLAPELSLQHQSTQTHEQQRASVATSETGTQLSTYFDRKTRRMQTLMSQKHVETQMAAEVEDAGVQSPNNWLQAFLEENEEERRSRMHEVGIQTGVLARVQHIFEQKQEEQQPSTSYLEVRRSMKTVPPESLMRGRIRSTTSLRTGEGSGSSTSTHSLHEGEEEAEQPEIDPQLTARHGRFWERQQTVGDLRSRLEKAQADQEKEKEMEKQRPRED